LVHGGFKEALSELQKEKDQFQQKSKQNKELVEKRKKMGKE